MKKFILFSLILIAGCTTEQMTEQIKYIKSGCIPSEIERRTLGFGDWLFREGSTGVYIYENDKLIRLGNYEYEYDGNKVSKIYKGSYLYEEYFYDKDNRVISSKQYRRDNVEEEFELNSHYDYEYIENQISKSKNKLNLQEKIFYRDEITFNVDSLITFNSNGAVTRSEYFEYDENPNIYTNVCTPKFNFAYWIYKTTKNNILKYELKVPDVPNDQFIGYSVDITYNEFDYPSLETVKYSTGGTTVREITYVNCE